MYLSRLVRPLAALSLLAPLAACSDPGPASAEPSQPAPPPPPVALTTGALTAAHQAYLAGDYLALGERVRDVLLDPGANPLARDNAMELLDKAYQLKGGSLPSRFTLPAGFSGIQIALRRFLGPHSPRTELRVAGSATDASRLAGLSLIGPGGDVVVDKASGKGSFSIRHDPEARRRGVEEFVLDSGPIEASALEGVLTLRLRLDDGTVSEGFVIAHALTPPEPPEILSPAPSEVVTGPNPLLRWSPLRASQPAFERGRVNVHVSRDGASSSLWEFSRKTSEPLTEVAMGSAAGTPATALAPGSYWLSVSAVESRRFGPVEVLRATRVTQPFSVAR